MALKTKTSCRGQSTLEYAVLVVILIGAMLAMQQYFRRGIMGRVRQSTEDISDTQFDPETFAAKSVTRTTSRTTELSGDVENGPGIGATETRLDRDEITRRRAVVLDTETGAGDPEEWDKWDEWDDDLEEVEWVVED